MSVPLKYRQLGDFPAYYRGDRTAPYLTLFIGGNHEASAHLWELFHGGWVCPNIYYLGAAGVVRVGPLRIAGMSGIWKGFDYNKPHGERLPFGPDDVKSFYHVREIDVRRLLLLRTQVDVGMSHDWPRAIERHGDERRLFAMKKDFKKESYDGTLGNPAAGWVMDRLRPRYWFSAHLHCKFAAVKRYPPAEGAGSQEGASVPEPAKVVEPEPKPAQAQAQGNPDEIDLDIDEGPVAEKAPGAGEPKAAEPAPAQPQGNSDEIDLDLDDEAPVPEEEPSVPAPKAAEPAPAQPQENPDEIDLDLDEAPRPKPTPTDPPKADTEKSAVPEDLRAQLPASFAKPARPEKKTPGQPVPPGITNREVRFLALDKCLPGRHFLQLCEIHASDQTQPPPTETPTKTNEGAPTPRFPLHYDAEWLAITRVFTPHLKIGDPTALNPPDLGEAHYAPLIDAELAWVQENLVDKGKMEVPRNFEQTAPVHAEGMPEIVHEQPMEYTNPQTAAFCEMLGVENLWGAGEGEREERRARGPPEGQFRGGRGGRGGGRGRGGRGGRGGGGGWRGRGRGRGQW